MQASTDALHKYLYAHKKTVTKASKPLTRASYITKDTSLETITERRPFEYTQNLGELLNNSKKPKTFNQTQPLSGVVGAT